jgi:DNA-binding response OmpR family regulator
MVRAHDVHARAAEPSASVNAAGPAAQAGAWKSQVLIVGADQALFGLIAEWLAADGRRAVMEHTADGAAPGRVELVVVDIPFPRRGGLDLLRRIAGERPGTPILALSSTFFAGIDSNGAVARALGVAGVLPKPVKRDALLAAVHSLMPAST